ncbi:MAG TPA: helix-turn-helix transcriptional regulator [Puia sp.]|jgi:AraC-like DNA-binding protein|nr:helix-turn-helix transcriptional regulator [Puia sp.]
MRIRYKVDSGALNQTGSDSRDPELQLFEDILGFREGFSQGRVPASIGEGTLAALDIDGQLHANFQFYRLDVPLQVIKEATGDPFDWIHIVFYDMGVPEKAYIEGLEVIYDQGVNIYTHAITATLQFPAHTQRNVVCLRIKRKCLESLLGDDHRAYLNELLQQGQSFFIHEQLSEAMRSLLGELKLPPAAKALQRFFYHVRVMQLIYLLMEQLNKRTIGPNKNDDPELIARVFQARSLLVRDLSAPPTIASLARSILMSESQLKQSFREIFGVSIYQYFQNTRLEKARQLLAANKHTVKEVGYELGFTNIGHFSRLFERAYHVKPKKFQLELTPEQISEV